MATTLNLGKIMPTFEGTYDATKTYAKLSVVVYQGSSYISKVQCRGVVPTDTTTWQLLAQKGDSITYDDLTAEQKADLKQEAIAAAQQATQAMQAVFDRIEDFDFSGSTDDDILGLDAKIGVTDARTSFIKGTITLAADLDSKNTVSDYGLYYYRGGGWKGLVSVQFDAQSTVSQVALSSSTPDYSSGGLVWVSGEPCIMSRTYSSGSWSNWVAGQSSEHPIETENDANGDFDLSDEAGYILLRLENGHVRTKNFYSGNIYTKSEVNSLFGNGVTQQQLTTALSAKQDVLTSGTNIKTINGTSLLGRGNIITNPQILRWNGKKVGALGDSITEGYNTTKTYLQYLEDDLGCTTYNYGLGGSRIVKKSTDTIASFVDRASSVRSDLDLLLVFGGINDFYFSECVLGEQYTVNSSTSKFVLNTDTTTFYGAYNSIMQTLITKLPTAQIYLLTPLHAGVFSTGSRSTWMINSNNLTIMDFVDAIKKVGLLWGVPVIDMCSVSGMNPNVTASQQAYFNHNVPSSSNPDYLHPDANGHRRIADTILKFI